MNSKWIEDLSAMRESYSSSEMHEAVTSEDPFMIFHQWFSEAVKASTGEANAMTLATAGKDGKPSARIVLLKLYGTDGFVFFTNYQSKKGIQIEENPSGALCFWWPEVIRQVRIEGIITRISKQDSDEYFNSRPLGSKLGAHASQQSKPVASRRELEDKMQQLSEQYQLSDPPRPDNWGGYILNPEYFEFWQGQENRLHDRFIFKKDTSGWKKYLLAP
jgi:pyridoxamine 5'-phosphate oxidase